jgi:2-keto-3-deoxy-L-arabinonate dehydratase
VPFTAAKLRSLVEAGGDLLRDVIDHHAAGRRTEAAAAYARVLPLINYENRQCGLRAAKIAMAEGGVIKSGAVRHPLDPIHPGRRHLF